MNRNILFIVLVTGLLSAMFQQLSYGRYGEEITDQNDVDSVIDVDSVTITLTHLDMNDTNLELGFKIVNNSDHDVWICDNYVDKFMDRDNETLVIRMRYNISNAGMLWEIPYPRFWYSRLGPDQEKVKSLSLALPVEPRATFKTSRGNAEHARRVALEIGYYDEDLRALILEIVNVRDKLGCDWSAISFAEVPQSTWEVYHRFFGGVLIAQLFNSPTVEYFHDSVMSDGDEIIAPYFDQALYGEQVLRLEVDNVSIPYKSNYPPLTDEPPQSETEPAGVTTVLTKFDVNDTKLELSWKIINNTDHDVWICDGLTTGYFECVLDKDNETLKIIKRSSLPQGPGWEHWPWVRFIRLRPGQEKEDSISLTVPVSPYTEFSHQRGNAEYARRVAIEIGFYDEDLRGLILNIIDLTERLNCDISLLSSIVAPEAQIAERFFTGVYIAQVFHDESFRGFQNKVLSDGDEIPMPFMGQLFHGEKVLRIEIDGVSIPYKSDYPPLND
jgi:hypothetical protein